MIDATSSAPHFERLVAGLVERRAGLHYRPLEHELFAQKLGDHVADAGFDSVADFYYHLRYDDPHDAALDDLIAALLVHETYFFRELPSLVAAVDRFVVPVVARGRRARIWSAACSTGEEPLSIAMLLAERGMLGHCEIIASDISERALSRARGGHYRARSVRGDGVSLVERWLVREANDYLAPQSLRDALDLRRVNLCDQAAVADLGQFDLVLCRNVMIYFDDATVARVLASLSSALRSEAALFVGVSESLLRFSTLLRCEEVDGVFLYRRTS